jgi:uncharacterized protein YjbJ (UPF0337 family)
MKGNIMTTSEIEKNWKTLKNSIKNEWNELTEDELNKMEGNWDKMVDTLALKYSLTKMEAEDQLNKWKIKVKDTLN